MALPRFIFLKSDGNKKYLRYLKEAGSNHARLRFSEDFGDDNSTELQYVKFQVQRSGLGDGLVHLKTCYNNKYLARKSADSNYIVAEANEAEEDQSQWSCTLFKTVLVEDVAAGDDVVQESWKIRLVHIDDMGQRNAFASATTAGGVDGEDQLLVVGGESGDDVFTVYNAIFHYSLPPYVAFKGPESKYASVVYDGGLPYMQFNTTDLGASGAAHTITNTGTYQAAFIDNRSISNGGGGWGLTDPYILANNAGNGAFPLRLFVAVSLGGSVVALRNQHNSKYIVPGSAPPGNNVLCATSTTITEGAKLEVVETVLSRTLSDVVYNLDDARMYDQSSPEMYSDSRENATSVPQLGTFEVKYEESHTTIWRESASFSWSVNVKWESPKIPFVGSVGIEVGVGGSHEWEWGTETTKTTIINRTEQLTVSPGKKLTLKVISSQASYDIPFSCTVTDLMTDGTTRTYTKTDGLFTGTNGYDFVSRVSEEDIPPT